MEKYQQYKNLFSGLHTQNDVNYFIRRCPTEDTEIIQSIIQGLKLENILSLNEIFHILDQLRNCHYKQDVEEIFNQYPHLKNNLFQSTLLTQILESYPECLPPKIKTPIIETFTKKCPHCHKDNTASKDIYYIVCGFDPQGLSLPDDTGCACDWCFQCGKRLCKNWYYDDLFMVLNQKHNTNCCKLHANKNHLKYPEDYCQCPQNRPYTIQENIF
jgi:hypothetical protein